MALDDLDDDEATENLDLSNANNSIANINADAPDFVKDIKRKQSSIPLDMDYQVVPQNPYTLGLDGKTGYTSGAEIDDGLKQNSSFLATAKAEAYDWNVTAEAVNSAANKYDELGIVEFPPADWTPKTDQSKFVNVQPQNLAYVLAATGPQDQDYRVQRVLEEQAHDETLANGSWTAKIIGGVVGALTDPVSYIPVVGWAKYGKLGSGFLKNAARALPGAAKYSVLSAGAKQADKVNGNLKDFLTESFTNTVFATSIFGLGGAVSVAADKLELWNLRKVASNYIDGIDFKLAVEDGKVTGYKAVNTKNETLSAQKVSFAQDLANSSFEKSGFFKIPYVGEAINKFHAMKIPGTEIYFGSQLQSLLSSPYKTVRGFIDRVADHSIITKGIAEGQAAPDKFASLMQQSMSDIRGLSAQVDALHLQRNGFDIKNRPLGGLVNIGLNLKNKGLKVLAKDIDKTGYTSKDQFYSEIEDVLVNENSSQHAPVNDAAKLMRKQMDETYRSYRKAYNLSEDWLPPKTAQAYLMRVYDTPYMNAHENEWIGAVGNWLKEADNTINTHMQPIKDIEDRIKNHTEKHVSLIARPNITDRQVKKSADELVAMKARKKALEENLQNELRTNPDLTLHVDDWNALSADEAKEIETLTKKQAAALKNINEQKKIIQDLKKKVKRKETASIKAKNVKTAKGNKSKGEEGKLFLEQEEAKLTDLQNKYDEETQRLQEQMHSGEIDSRLFYKEADSFIYHFKDTSNRLKFRDVYGSEKNPISPEGHAKAYYDTIMNQTPQDTINQVMGRFTGNGGENPLKQRTLLIPDSVLYENNFMSKDLMAKVANYSSYLSRRTHLKSVFNDVTIDGGIEPLLVELNNEHEQFRIPLNQKKGLLQEKLKEPDLTEKEKNDIEKQIKSVEKEFTKTRKEFDAAANQMNHLYQKMMGTKKYSKGTEQARSVIMSLTAIANLPFVPFTQINDLAAIGLQHGLWPFIRDGIYPLVQNLATFGKGKDAEAFRKTAPSIHLALQDVLNGYADRNWGMYTDPYLNLGKIVNTIEKVAHASSNFTLTNYIDNGLQRITASVTQSELMRILQEYKKGTMSKRDGLYIRKYGIDPEKWADRMTAAFKAHGGGKTSLGGYQTLFYQWHDMEAANTFGSAVFRGVKDTQIQSGIADSPFWTDSPMGSIIKGFNGWMYASVNRYVIPAMQQPDAQKLLGVLFMLGSGALIDPMRRMARGDTPYPENITDKQKMYAAWTNSGVFSFYSTALADANVLTGDKLLGNLRSDKYKDRTRAGLLGPGWGTFNRLVDVIDAAATGEWNKADMTKAARMVPFANASWTYWLSKKLIDSLDIPATRRQAHALKGE